MAMQTGGLPGAYQQVDYLQTDGNQYITGITITFDGNPIAFYCKYKLLALKSYGPHIFSAGQNGLWLVNRAAGAMRTIYNVDGTNYGYSVNAPIDTIITATIENGYGSIDDIGESFEVPPPQASTRSCAIFTYVSSADSATYRAAMVLYSLKIDGASGAILNMIPCIRKSDSKPGMYDTVSKTFYTNAGTGEFIVPD